MKKAISLILVVVMLCSTFAELQISSYAALPSSGSCGENVTYTFSSSTGTLIISGSGAMNSYKYSSSPFKNKEDIKKVYINSGVTSIGDSAFYCCSNITNFSISNSVTSIGESAFYHCKGLTNITIPDSVTKIGDYAFWECTGLTSITIPDSITSIGEGTFRQCSKLTSIAIPDSVTSIGKYSFSNCSGLKELTMPCSAKIYNGFSTFINCTNIEKVTLTKGTGTMQNYASSSDVNDTYYQYTPWYISKINMKYLVIEDGITNIGDYAFKDSSGLTRVSIPDSVKSIGVSAFFDCSRLTLITIGNSVTSIGNSAFEGCSGLESVYLYSKDIDSTQSLVASMPVGSTLYAYEETDARTYCSIYGVNYVPLADAQCDEGIHDYIETITKAATCEEAGIKTLTCRFCGESVTETIPALGHAWSGWQIITAPSCEKTGLSMRICNTCNQIDTLVIPVLVHSFSAITVESTCTHAGYTTFTCEDCGYSYIGDIVPMAEHSFKETVVEPTTESQGYTVHTCTACGYSYVDSITDILPSHMHYIIPSLADIQTTVTIKSNENEYSVTATDGVFELNNIKSDVYRVYAKPKNALTVLIDEYNTDSGEVVNNNPGSFPLGDVNGDDVIDFADISLLLATGNYGKANAELDLTGEGTITVDDIALVLQAGNYGKSSVAVV